MKLKITLSSDNDVVLPIHYNYILQSFIYRNMDKVFSDFLHDQGFRYKKRSFKLFTFSSIFGKCRILRDLKAISFSPPIHFYLSSNLNDVLSSHVKNLIINQSLNLGNNLVYLSEVETIFEDVKSEDVILKTLSPVTVHTTNENGRTTYYKPYQQEFFRLIEDNLKRKCLAANVPIERPIEVSAYQDVRYRKVVTFYKNGFVIEAWKGKFNLKANPEVIRLALDAGIGDRNSQGFGMVILC